MELSKHELQIVSEEAVSPELDEAIKALLCECFPPDVPLFSQCRWWNGCAPEYSLVYQEGGAVLGHVGIVHRTLTCGGVPAEVAGIQSLAVSPSLRGTGLAQKLMTESMEEAKRRGIPYGFLFCSPQLERFYASLGWQRSDVEITMLDEAGSDAPLTEKCVAMYLNLTDESFPEGEIHLQGRNW